MYRAILFDMDGLMIDTEPIYWAVERELAIRHEAIVSDATLRKMMGRSRLDSMRIFAEDCRIDTSPEDLLVAREQMMLDRYALGVEPMPGLHSILQRFHGQLKLGVVTSSPKKFTDVLLPALGVAHLFDVVQTGDEIDRGKPDPQIYLRAISRLGLEPGECVVLEDSHSGALAGHRAGAFVIAVPSPLTMDDDFSFVNARGANLEEAKALLERGLSIG